MMIKQLMSYKQFTYILFTLNNIKKSSDALSIFSKHIRYL